MYNKKNKKPWHKKPAIRNLLSALRWLHVYCSALLFSLLLFFCLTGFTLNHAGWFETKAAENIKVVSLPEQMALNLLAQQPAAIGQLTEYLDKAFGLGLPAAIDLQLDMAELSLDYPRPGGYVFVTVLLDERQLEISRQAGTAIGVLNDLHKGRHSGLFWSLLIDVSAVLVSILSLAGVVLLVQNRKNRNQGFAVVGLGLMLPICLYLLFIPG